MILPVHAGRRTEGVSFLSPACISEELFRHLVPNTGATSRYGVVLKHPTFLQDKSNLVLVLSTSRVGSPPRMAQKESP